MLDDKSPLKGKSPFLTARFPNDCLVCFDGTLVVLPHCFMEYETIQSQNAFTDITQTADSKLKLRTLSI